MQSDNPIYLNPEHEKIFEKTCHIPGWQLPGDSFKLYAMAYENGDAILEIGTYGGRSATVELRGALANPQRMKPPQFFGIEIDIHGIWRSYTSLKSEKLEQYALLFHGDLKSFTEVIPIKPTMVFVDGDHSYNGVREDLALLSNILSPGTPILCHDYTNPENDTGELGVRQAVNEFVKHGFATFEGTFGCSAFLIATEKCQAKAQAEWTQQEFLEQKVRQLESQGQSLYLRWVTSEAEYTERLEAVSRLQAQSTTPYQVEGEAPELETGIGDQPPAGSKLQASDFQEIHKNVKDLEHQLRIAHSQIKAMKTSKFWKMRELWIRAKRLIGLSTNEIV